METRTSQYDGKLICLSKNLKDKYVNTFAIKNNFEFFDYDYDYGNTPILIRGMTHKDLIHKCWKYNHLFYYMDSGYFGNHITPFNDKGYKIWHRIVPNNLQHTEIIERPDDRLKKTGVKIHRQRKGGEHILLVTPSSKPCEFYGIDRDTWVKDTIEEIKKYTDRPIIVRDKLPRKDRHNDSIYYQFQRCHAVVTYQSIAAVESVAYGIPAFTLAPSAADPVCDKDISQIENPTLQDYDKVYAWASHLAYGQVHMHEVKKGYMDKLLYEIG